MADGPHMVNMIEFIQKSIEADKEQARCMHQQQELVLQMGQAVLVADHMKVEAIRELLHINLDAMLDSLASITSLALKYGIVNKDTQL